MHRLGSKQRREQIWNVQTRMAVIAGSTGAVGRQRMDLLIASPRFEKILVLHHRPTPYSGQGKVKQLVVDFAAFPAQPQEMSLQGHLRKYLAVHGKTVVRGMLPSRGTISRLSLTMPNNGFPATPAKESNIKRPRDTVQPFPVSSPRLAVGGQASVRRSAR